MKFFLPGLIIAASFFIYGLFVEDRYFVAQIVGTIGVVSLLCSGLFTGAFNSGDGIRVIFMTENKEDRNKRITTAINFFLFGIPSLIASIVLFLI